jgi:hypothetical protein
MSFVALGAVVHIGPERYDHGAPRRVGGNECPGRAVVYGRRVAAPERGKRRTDTYARAGLPPIAEFGPQRARVGRAAARVEATVAVVIDTSYVLATLAGSPGRPCSFARTSERHR